jgi:ATP-dependent Zn protease
MERKTRLNVIYLVVAIMGVLVLRDVWTQYRTVAPVPYSEFRRLLENDKVEEVVISQHEVRGTLAEPVDDRTKFVATRVDPELGHMSYDTEPASFLGAAVPGIKSRSYSEETAREIDSAVRDLLRGAFDSARAILERNRDVLEEGAADLLAKETLGEAELRRLFERATVAQDADETGQAPGVG